MQAGSGDVVEQTLHSGITRTNHSLQYQNGVSPSDPQPAQTVSRNSLSLTTRAGLPRQRIRWTTAMNKDIMRCHYKATKCGTSTLGYRNRQYRYFNELYPYLESRLNEQNVASRVRAILTRNMISQVELTEISLEIQEELQPSNRINLIRSSLSTENALSTSQEETVAAESINDQVNEFRDALEPQDRVLFQSVLDTFEESILQYGTLDPSCRPKIPKIYLTVKSKKTLEFLNAIVGNLLVEHHTIEYIHSVIFCAAITVCKISGLKIEMEGNGNARRDVKPAWQRRLEGKKSRLRAEIGRLTKYKAGIRSRHLLQKVRAIIGPESMSTLTPNILNDFIDRRTQMLQATSSRLRRYMASKRRKTDNKLFTFNQRKFYRQLEENNSTQNSEPEIPTQPDIELFWAGLWESNTMHTANPMWDATSPVPQMHPITITQDDLKVVLRKTKNWKSPGVDGVQNFWLKKLHNTHQHLASSFNKILNGEEDMPTFLTMGKTYLLFKSGDSKKPENYRPITCLPTLYKALTAILSQKIYDHCAGNDLLPIEQRGCAKNSRGCKELITIDAIITRNSICHHRNLSVAFIDYKKAFDSVPHSYLLQTLKNNGVDEKIVSFFERAMSSWRTNLILRGICTREIHIRRGIFQGDTFSPLWFCLSLSPLSRALNNSPNGYRVKYQQRQAIITHLLYMDDLKLFARSRYHLENLLNIVEKFSSDICMQFGFDKCRSVEMIRGQLTQSDGFSLNDGVIQMLEFDQTYKYLGVEEMRGIHHTTIRNKLEERFEIRMRKLCRTKLNAINLFRALNTFAIPILTYSFGLIMWSDTELESIHRKIRTTLTRHGQHHPQAAVERVILSRTLGGQGLVNIPNQHYSQIGKLRDFFYATAATSDKYFILVNTDQNYTPLKLAFRDFEPLDHITNEATIVDRWKHKAIHGRFPHQLLRENVDGYASTICFRHGQLFPETEAFLMAIQDGILPTRNYRRIILHEDVEGTCRRCGQAAETTEHIINGCTTLAGTAYLKRHNNVAKIVHQMLAVRSGFVENSTPYYQYQPAEVMFNRDYRLYWDRSMSTDRTINANRPDIIWIDKNRRQGYIIDIAIPLTDNVNRTIGDKLAKYADLAFEIKQREHLKRLEIVPIVISSTGVVVQIVSQYLNDLGLSRKVHIMCKATVLETCRIMRSFLN